MPPHIRVAPFEEHTDFAQRGKKWKLLRRTMMTASNTGKVHNRGHHDTGGSKKQLDESYTKPFDPNEFDKTISVVGRDCCDYGTNMEEGAVEAYERVVKHYYNVQYPDHIVVVKTTPVSFYIHDSGNIMASPDSEVDVTVSKLDGTTVLTTTGVLEVKCPCGTYFGKRDSRYIKSTKNPITYAMWPDLIPTITSSTDRKYGPGSLPTPRLHLGQRQQEKDLYRERSSLDRHFSIDGRYSQYFAQCLLNLFLSERDWCDFFVWADGTPNAKGKTHAFWYKPNRVTDPFPNIHMERIYRNDPLIVEQFNDLMNSIKLWTQSNSEGLSQNIEEFIQTVSQEGGGEPVVLPELSPAELEDLCPESEFHREETPER